MRFWIIVLGIIVLAAAIFTSSDLGENVSWNPLGNEMEMKTIADDDDMKRELSVIDNNQEPEWGTYNFGNLADTKTTVEDKNGTSGTQILDAAPMMDMEANSKAESKVAPLPDGATVYVLPGVQPNGKFLNSFVFSPNGSNTVKAPRNYYASTHIVSAGASNKGTISNGNPPKEAVQTGTAKATKTNITVFQVPYGAEHFVVESTGTSKTATESQKVAKSIDKTLTDLTKLWETKASRDKLDNLLFNKERTGLSTQFNNINNLLNTGRYSDGYKKGISIALGQNNGNRSLPKVNIKSDITNNDVYGQFDFIYESLASGSGSGTYSPELVSWGKKNANTITHLLMVNYMFQSQYRGTGGGYTTPMGNQKWGEGKLPFFTQLNKAGRSSKEPFYLYCVINPKVVNSVEKSEKVPKIPSKYIEPDLSYIYSLYTGIMAHIWIGADGKVNNNTLTGDRWQSQTWEDLVNNMSKRASSNKVKGNNLPKDANSVSQAVSEYKYNQLFSGLSSQSLGERGTSKVFANREIVGALRALMSKGEVEHGDYVKLDGKNFKITPIGETKYTKKGTSYLYRNFVSGGHDTFTKWKTMVVSASNTPLQPATFASQWGDNGTYIMLPTMLGGNIFPKSLGVMIEELLLPENSNIKQSNLSYANHYIMAFNFKSNPDALTKNTTGVKEAMTNARMGSVLDTKKPIVFTGYNGGESFSIIDYFKVQDALNKSMDMPPISAKTVEGKQKQLTYLNLFKDFFTIKTEHALIGDGKGKLKYTDGFDKEAYKMKYEANRRKMAISQVSPDYSVFFTPAEKVKD